MKMAQPGLMTQRPHWPGSSAYSGLQACYSTIRILYREDPLKSQYLLETEVVLTQNLSTRSPTLEFMELGHYNGTLEKVVREIILFPDLLLVIGWPLASPPNFPHLCSDNNGMNPTYIIGVQLQ